jgi:ATP-dependent DNA helicase UvrD/PcrA
MNLDEFIPLAEKALGVDLQLDANGNESPHRSLIEPGIPNQYIVAGPGTGKTTALALLALKAIFVDGYRPDALVATTFTRKAAAELRSRIMAGIHDVLGQLGLPVDDPAYDVAAVRVGTIDQLCEEAMIELQVGAVVEQITQNGTMRDALFRGRIAGRAQDLNVRAQAQTLLRNLFGSRRDQERATTIRDRLLTLRERISHDMIDADAWCASGTDETTVRQVIDLYLQTLRDNRRLDFALLEEEFLEALENGQLGDWLAPVRVVLVDEYQDTNLLQETIYRCIAQHLQANDGWLALVGDDDQSLFRFRGATVDLFVQARARFGLTFQFAPLNVNYRSSKPIISLANRFIDLDLDYRPARVTGKPPLVEAADRTRWQATDQVPVLGVFRPDLTSLADGLTSAIRSLVGAGWTVPGHAQPLSVGSPGDIAVIGQSTSQWTGGGNPRIFLALEQELSALNPPIKFFNPRGTSVADVPLVQILLGLALLCLDETGALVPGTTPFEARTTLQNWRAEADGYLNGLPPPNQPHSLRDFVRSWQRRKAQGQVTWPREFPLMELLHELAVWIPTVRDTPGVLYLEALTRTLEAVGTLLGPTGTLIFRDRWDESVARLYWNFFIPVACDEIDLDEEVLESLPLDSVNALTVHQAKGLEFPVCFVDVGSGFSRVHWAQAFQRYPEQARLNDPYSLEDVFRTYSPLPPPARSRRDRAFDDLTRTFFVAFTRAQHLLVMFGLGDQSGPRLDIPNVATGFVRGSTSPNWNSLGVTCI